MLVSLPAAASPARPTVDAAAMPEILYEAGDTRHAVFLEASKVLGDGGKIKAEAPLTRISEKNLRNVLAQPLVNGCLALDEVFFDYVNRPRRNGLAATVAAADFIVEGTVVNKSFGFVEGIPGQLLRIHTITELTGSVRPLPQYYIFIPIADFTVGGAHFCKTDARYTAPPSVGDKVFVFGDKDFTSGEYIDTLGATGYVRSLPDGKLLLPHGLQVDNANGAHDSDIRRMAIAARAGRVQ